MKVEKKVLNEALRVPGSKKQRYYSGSDRSSIWSCFCGPADENTMSQHHQQLEECSMTAESCKLFKNSYSYNLKKIVIFFIYGPKNLP